MQTVTSREAQLRFGAFSRDAQKDVVIVTNHGQPVFMAIPVRITSAVAELIGKVDPVSPAEAAKALDGFFDRLAKTHTGPMMDEKSLSDFIKSPD